MKNGRPASLPATVHAHRIDSTRTAFLAARAIRSDLLAVSSSSSNEAKRVGAFPE